MTVMTVMTAITVITGPMYKEVHRQDAIGQMHRRGTDMWANTHLCIYVYNACESYVLLRQLHRADAQGRVSHDDCWKRQLQRQGGERVPRR